MSGQDDIAALVETHAKWLSAFLRGLTRSEADADDAFQDVWMRAIRSGGLQQASSPRAYLAKVARMVVIDRHRRNARYAESLDVADDSGETGVDRLVGASPSVNGRVAAADLHEAVLAAVRALPAGPRQVVLLRIEAGLKYEAIAAELGVPLGTALTWMRTATRLLRKRLGDEDGRGS